MTVLYKSDNYDIVIFNTEIMTMIVEGGLRRKTNYCLGTEKTSLYHTTPFAWSPSDDDNGGDGDDDNDNDHDDYDGDDDRP